MTLTTFQQLYKEYQDSGFNVLDFCSNQGMAPSSFYYWKKKLGDNNEDLPKRFVPLVIDSFKAGERVLTNRININTSYNGSSSAPIEFVFPNGTKMIIREAVDVTLLKTIVHLFD